MKEQRQMTQDRKIKNEINSNKAITLIALVITIIVLLILAGVTIATLTAENGILTQAESTKTASDVAEIIERVKIDIAGVQAEKEGKLPKEDLDRILKSYDKDGTIKLDEEGNRYIVTSKNNIVKVSDIWSETPVILAGRVLKTDSTATDAATKSPYVKYNGIDCRVLYNDETHGLQIITANSVKDVTLGSGDEAVTASDFTYDGKASVDDNFKHAAASYNNAVDTLNNIAKTYKDTKGVARDARCLGSNPILKDGVFQSDASGMWSSTDYTYLTTYSWNNKFKTSDDKHSDDVKQLNNLGINVSSGYTWLASRNVSYDSDCAAFIVRLVDSSGSARTCYLCFVFSGGTTSRDAPSCGFRPVFLLSSDAVISGGDGSSESPYVIEKSDVAN